MQSQGTTVYYRDSSRGSAPASEAVGGRGRRQEEDDRDGELMGLTGLKTAKAVIQREKTRGVAGYVRAGTEEAGRVTGRPLLSCSSLTTRFAHVGLSV